MDRYQRSGNLEEKRYLFCFNRVELLKILEEKSTRIEFKVSAMRQYEAYLESVKDYNPDEYQELSDILSRYWTLKDSNTKLTQNLHVLEHDLDSLKNTVSKYEKDQKTEIMSLNNEIASQQHKFEGIEDQKNKLRSEADETSSKKLRKVSELARILMAVDNLENRCLNRKDKSALKYPLQALVNLDDPKNFNLFKERCKAIG